MAYPSDWEIFLGKMAGFAAMFGLVSVIIRAGNQEWGWMAVTVVPTAVLAWVAFMLLRTD